MRLATSQRYSLFGRLSAALFAMDLFMEMAFDDTELDMLMAIVHDDLLDVDPEEAPRNRGGSRPGRVPNKNRNRVEGARRLHLDYFADEPVYSQSDFRRRFRMRKDVFTRPEGSGPLI